MPAIFKLKPNPKASFLLLLFSFLLLFLTNLIYFPKTNDDVSTHHKAIHFYDSKNILDHVPNNFYNTHSLFLKLREISTKPIFYVPKQHVLSKRGHNYRARLISIAQPKDIITPSNTSGSVVENALSAGQARCTEGWSIQESGSTNIDLALGYNGKDGLKFKATDFESWGGGPRIILDASEYDGKTVTFSVEEVTISGLSSNGKARLMIEDRKGEPGNYSHQADSYYFDGNGTFKNKSVTRDLRTNIDRVFISLRIEDDPDEIVTATMKGVQFGKAKESYFNLSASDILPNLREHEIYKGVLWNWPGHARKEMYEKSTSWEIYVAEEQTPDAFVLIASEDDDDWRFLDANLLPENIRAGQR